MSSDKSGGQFLALIFKSEGQTLVNFLFCLLKCWNHFVSSHVKRWVEVLENINQSQLSIVLTFSKLTLSLLMTNRQNYGKIYPKSNRISHDLYFYSFQKNPWIDAVLFEHEQMIVVEGSAMATQSKSALVELISYCEDELEIQNFVIAVPKKRHDHRIFGE